jgi:hypothetical protein
MKLAHIVAEYALCTIDDIATMVGSMPFAKSTHNLLISASIHAARWLLVAMFDAILQLEQSSSKMHGYIHASTVCKTKPTRTICIDTMSASVVLTLSG